MKIKNLILLMIWSFSLAMFVACSDDSLSPDEEDDSTTETEVDSEETIADADAQNSGDHDDEADYSWDSSEELQIVLNGSSISTEAEGVSINGSIATVTASGTYRVSGSLSDGQLIVDTEDEEIVRLILDGVSINSANSSPIYVANAEKTMIVLADNSENYLEDGASYVFYDQEDEEPDATIFSKDNLTLYGNGALTVVGNFNEAIKSKDGLIISSGNYTVTSVDDGIQGKDYLIIKDGSFTLDVEGDGLKSNNDDDTSLGYIAIQNGSFDITAGGDAIQAETDLMISDGDFTLTAGGGSDNAISEDLSAKGIKAGVSLVIEKGTFSVNTADDAIHSNAGIAIHSGTFDISSGDDGMHADATLTINGGEINITKSYEGLESAVITINDGTIHLVSSDDGLNVAGGADGSGFGRPGQGSFSGSSDYYMYLNGGYIVVNADGDGLDANGSIEMTGGTVIVNGPTSNGNGALDYDASFEISGGFLIAAGSSGMVQAPGSASSQASVAIGFSSSLQAGTLFHLETSDGEEVLSFAPLKSYQAVVVSSPELSDGTTYDAYYGGSSTGTLQDGLYQDGTYTPGTEYASFTISGAVTSVNISRGGW